MNWPSTLAANENPPLVINGVDLDFPLGQIHLHLLGWIVLSGKHRQPN